jgi:flagellar basal-body rod protein FlgF
MDNSQLVGLSRQVVLMRHLDVVSNNIANMNTTGFKADNMLFEEHLASAARATHTNGRLTNVSFVHDRGIWRDFSQGPVQATGNPLDIAIVGEGFLTVQTPDGERYTRNGSLQIAANGQLVTNDGFTVLGENGPITFQQTDRNVAISKDGRITVNEGSNTITEGVRGKLRVVRFAQPQNLQKDGLSNFVAPEGTVAQPVTNVIIQQAVLEKSNINAVLEMTRLIDITRTYTQIATMLQQQHELRQSAIQKLAEIPA